MPKAFLSFCFFVLSIVFATSTYAAALQSRFDKLIERHSFGNSDVAELRSIMAEEKESGEKVDCTFCSDDFTWYLVENRFFDEAIWLFDHNADYGIKSKQDGMTLLHAVCRDGHQEFAELLIERGAEINLPDEEGRTAIHYAVVSGNSKLVESLLKLGSDPNRLTKRLDTPLHFAVRHSHLEEVKLLIENGASIKAVNWPLVENLIEQRRHQDTILNDANEARILSLKKHLGLKIPEVLQAEDEEEEEAEEEENVHKKRRNNDFLAKKVDFNRIPVEFLPLDVTDAANIDGMTALHFAAQNGDTDVVRYLVEHGADINAQDDILSRSVIHLAAENGNLDCIKYLTEQGANLLDRDSYGATAFHYAARSNRLDVAKYLVSKKMDYTAKDVRGWTAMHYAASGGSLDIVKYLLAKGLNINERAKSGRTPLFFAREHREVRKFMLTKGAQ